DCVFANGDTLWSSAFDFTAVERCTFDGAQVDVPGGFAILHQSIFRNVPSPTVTPLQFATTYCDIQGIIPGNGNFDANPRGVDPAAHDSRLQPGSPCIDAGDPAAHADPDLSVQDLGALRLAAWDDLGGSVGIATSQGQAILEGQGLLVAGE